jgi:hypothetical protein
LFGCCWDIVWILLDYFWIILILFGCWDIVRIFGGIFDIVWMLLGYCLDIVGTFWDIFYIVWMFLGYCLYILEYFWIFLILFGCCWDIVWIFTSVKLSSFCCVVDNRMGCTFSSVVLDSVFDYCNAFTSMGRAVREKEWHKYLQKDENKTRVYYHMYTEQLTLVPDVCTLQTAD